MAGNAPPRYYMNAPIKRAVMNAGTPPPPPTTGPNTGHPNPPPTPKPTTQGGGGQGGGGGGGGGGQGGGVQGGTPAAAPGPSPTSVFQFKAPWEKGLGPFPSVKQAADWVRSHFQLMMGDLSGWPYNSNLASGAYFTFSLVSGDSTIPAVPFPVQMKLSLSPADSTSTGSATGSVDATTYFPNASLAGSFYRTMNYNLAVTYALPKSANSFTQTFGPFSGQAISNQSNPMQLPLVINDFPATIETHWVVQYPDGKPAGGVFVIVSVTPASDPTDTVAQLAGYTDGMGAVSVGSGADIFPSGEYIVTVLVYPSQMDTTLLYAHEFKASGVELIAGSLKETITLPPPGFTANAGLIEVHFIHGAGLIAAFTTYDYSVTNQLGDVLAHGTGEAGGSGSAMLAPPTGFKDTDTLTLEVSGTWEGHTGSGTAVVSGADFQRHGIDLNVSVWSGGTPPPHGR